MKRLKYYLTPFEKGFTFRVENQSERITNALKTKSFVASNGWRVSSDDGPGIDVDRRIIYLRGFDKDMDYRIDRTYNLCGNYDRDRYISAINKAIEEFVDRTYSYAVPEIHMSTTCVSSPFNYTPCSFATRCVYNNYGTAQLKVPRFRRARSYDYYDAPDSWVVIIR